MAAIEDVVPCETTVLIWFLLHRLRIVDGLIEQFSTLYNAFAFSIIVANVPCISQAVNPSCFLFFFSSS
jgi:hypothetical protein